MFSICRKNITHATIHANKINKIFLKSRVLLNFYTQKAALPRKNDTITVVQTSF